MSTTGKLFDKLILRTIHKHIEERNLLDTSQFGFRADHSTTFQCMSLVDHVIIYFNNNMSTAAVFVYVEKTLTKHRTLAYFMDCQN
jgi:hypothetical protein